MKFLQKASRKETLAAFGLLACPSDALKQRFAACCGLDMPGLSEASAAVFHDSYTEERLHQSNGFET